MAHTQRTIVCSDFNVQNSEQPRWSDSIGLRSLEIEAPPSLDVDSSMTSFNDFDINALIQRELDEPSLRFA